MDTALASHILDALRDHMHLHVGFCQWTRDDGVSLWVCSARDNDGQRWVAGGESAKARIRSHARGDTHHDAL
ncbi:MAG: hypothetical protein IH985_09300 [Planctomycetes bacterium]|nr:hypothetical protein [Planctomycetota bacterium]